MKTNWNKLDTQLGSTQKIQSYGSYRSQKALETILGEEWIEDTLEKSTFLSGQRSLFGKRLSAFAGFSQGCSNSL